jgi:ABC-type polysaccharide/polyol phosphate transport system ATPase subunit
MKKKEEEPVISIFEVSKKIIQNQILKDISFEIYKGEAVGLIGNNGAGKSTLLKILAGIIKPSSGSIKIIGKAISILDVGSGFHPDLTGRENIYMLASIYGINRNEVDDFIVGIIDFSESLTYIDKSVSTYSNGMYLRVAFAAVFHFNVDILILDEVIGVGDAAFKMKCEAKISELLEQKKTLLIASHDLINIQNYCSRCIWIENGSLKNIGEANTVVNSYMIEKIVRHIEIIKINQGNNCSEQNSASLSFTNFYWSNISNDQFYVKSASVKDFNQNESGLINTNDAFEIDFVFEYLKFQEPLSIILNICNLNGIELISSSYIFDESFINSTSVVGKYIANFKFPSNMLHPGKYLVGFILFKESGDYFKHVYPVLAFDVIFDRNHIPRKFDLQPNCIKYSSASSIEKLD